MFHVNDYVMYGTKGACQITDIGRIDFGKKDTDYYFLKPIADQSGTLYVEVGSDKVRMRNIVSKEEADQIIERMADAKGIWIENEKSREKAYREAIESGNCDELVQLLKGLYERKEVRIQEGKKVTDVDGRAFVKAEGLLHGELAIALNISVEEVEDYIKNHNSAMA